MGEGLSWVCRSGQYVKLGDVVAVVFEYPGELVGEICGGTRSQVDVLIIDSKRWGDKMLTLSPENLLLKI